MTQRWRIKVSGKARKEPDIGELVRAVIALGEQIARETKGDDEITPDASRDGIEAPS